MAVSFAEINGTTIAYDVIGDGPPLLLLNGVMMTMQSWALQAVGCAYPPEWFGAFAKLCEAAGRRVRRNRAVPRVRVETVRAKF